MNVATELNKELLSIIAAESIVKLSGIAAESNPRSKNAKSWINAIAKAVVEIEDNPYLTYDLDAHELTILSSHTGNIYKANGTCSCKAFQARMPCFHRAAARLIAIYVERLGTKNS